jgi:hypothetical protein
VNTIVILSFYQIMTGIDIVNGRLWGFGCLSFKEKTEFANVPSSLIAQVRASRPEWCEGPGSTSLGLRSKPPETSKAPYVIRSWANQKSNAIRGMEYN